MRVKKEPAKAKPILRIKIPTELGIEFSRIKNKVIKK
jgi:hypothetical protein